MCLCMCVCVSEVFNSVFETVSHETWSSLIKQGWPMSSRHLPAPDPLRYKPRLPHEAVLWVPQTWLRPHAVWQALALLGSLPNLESLLQLHLPLSCTSRTQTCSLRLCCPCSLNSLYFSLIVSDPLSSFSFPLTLIVFFLNQNRM